MPKTDSWWLKVKRAQKHMADIKRAIDRYGDKHPYKAELVTQPKVAGDYWRYVLRITEQPDPMLPMLIGDFVHNLRSALDHWVVAHVPKNRSGNASFPIRHVDPWATDSAGDYLQKDDVRDSYDRSVKGLNDLSLTLIRSIQPYQLGEELVSRQQVGILSRLENADKHRDLIQLHVGFQLSVLTRIVHDLNHDVHKPGHFTSDGGHIVSFKQEWPLTESEVTVTMSGKAHLSVFVPVLGGGKSQAPEKFAVIASMRNAMTHVRLILRLLDASVTYEPARTMDIFALMGEPPEKMLALFNDYPPPKYTEGPGQESFVNFVQVHDKLLNG